MAELPTTLYTTKQVDSLDNLAIAQGIPSHALMETAGAAAFQALQQRWPQVNKVTVFCGSGNNGGDGYVLARLAKQQGFIVQLVALTAQKSLPSAAEQAARDCRAADVEATPFKKGIVIEGDVVVDALLGTGLQRVVEGDWAEAITLINRSEKPILAIDIPSGLNGDTGHVFAHAVNAHCTVTFIGLKQGLFTAFGPQHCGDIVFADLGVPCDIYDNIQAQGYLLEQQRVTAQLQKRPRHCHKGDCGHVLVIGGDYGMAGAARMAAEAAGRVGAGLVSVATRAEHVMAITSASPEFMIHGVDERRDISPLLSKATVVVVGPGLGRSPWAQSLLMAALQSELPLVIDADALNLLAQGFRALSMDANPSARWVLTPHPGEAARLVNYSTGEVQRSRFKAAKALQACYGGVCVLKGCGTIIQTEQETLVCSAGNPGMASGGMGDVLSGVIAGLIAQGLSLADAASVGVFVHAQAADCAAKSGERGLLARDVIAELRHLVNP